MVIYRDYGDALNEEFTGTFTKQQYIYKNPYPQLHFGLFAYEQKLLEDRLDWQVAASAAPPTTATWSPTAS